MNNTAFIFGAGRTGRGFAAHLAFLSGYDIVLIDKNKQLIADLKKAGKYDIQVFGDEEMSGTVTIAGAYDVDDVSWHDIFVETTLVFTAVFGNNLEELSRNLAAGLHKRYIQNPAQLLAIITCENQTNAAHILKGFILKNLDQEKEEWLSNCIGFSESIIFKTCLNASLEQPPLTIRAQNNFELPCDGDELMQPLHLYGLKPLKNFNHQLKRKIYTYNCINAVITYLGAKKGYVQLYEAGNDEAILQTAKKAADETSRALIMEYGFDSLEQKEWVNAAFVKFGDRNIPDPIDRNGADPARKLSREDRLVGPALLALKHGVYPEGLMEGITACFDYYDPDKGFKITDLINRNGIDFVLTEVCGISPDEELFALVKQKFASSNMNGN